MEPKTISDLTSKEAFATDADADAAGRIVANGFASEMERLARAFRLDKIAAEGEASEEEAEEAGETKDDELGEDLIALLQELGGL